MERFGPAQADKLTFSTSWCSWIIFRNQRQSAHTQHSLPSKRPQVERSALPPAGCQAKTNEPRVSRRRRQEGGGGEAQPSEPTNTRASSQWKRNREVVCPEGRAGGGGGKGGSMSDCDSIMRAHLPQKGLVMLEDVVQQSSIFPWCFS